MFKSILAIALLSVAPVKQESIRHAAPKAACEHPSATLRERLPKMVANDSTFQVWIYNGDRALKIMKAINEDSDPTDWVDDEVFVVTKTEAEKVFIMLASHGCVDHSFAVSISHWRELIRESIGADI